MFEKSTFRAINRRHMIAGGIAMSAAAPLVTQASADETAEAPVSPDAALQRLVEGNKRYVEDTPINVDHSANRAARALGQQPFAAIVSCADSRVAPELIFDQGPGDLFVIRVAGNFINEDGLASLEFGTAMLGVKLIVVLGHTSCGAIDAAITSIRGNALPPGHLPSLVNSIRPAVYDAMAENPTDLMEAATAQNARLAAQKAASSGPILSDLTDAGKLKAVSAVYDIGTGKVDFL